MLLILQEKYRKNTEKVQLEDQGAERIQNYGQKYRTNTEQVQKTYRSNTKVQKQNKIMDTKGAPAPFVGRP